MKANQGKSHASADGGDEDAAAAAHHVSSSLSAKALEYYRMYAASEELPKYFTGDYDLPPLDTLRHVADTAPQPPLPPPPPIPEIVVEEVCASPTSSIVSKEGRKQLEWDNGADIGYVNCDAKLREKSVSMPILDEGDVARRRQLQQLQQQTPATTEGLRPSTDGAGGDARSVSNDDYEKHREVMSFLRRKVGLPTAQSTPLTQEIRKSGSDPAIYSQTPKIPSKSRPNTAETKEPRVLKTTVFNYEVEPSAGSSKATPETFSSSNSATNETNLNTTLPNKTKYFARYRSVKLKNLQIAPPMSLECLSTVQTEDCQTQTTQAEVKQKDLDFLEDDIEMVKTAEENRSRQSIGIQTSRRLSKQEIIYLFHPAADMQFEKCTDRSGKSTSVSTTTTTSRGKSIDDKVFSNCNSFEYLHGSGDCQETAAVSDGIKTSSTDSANSLPKDQSTSTTSTLSMKELSTNVEKSTLSTKEMSSNDDMAMSLKIMKKLIKSNKYDDNFKQLYLRKIAQKLVASPLSRDSKTPESETNSSSSKMVKRDSDKMVENNPNLPNIRTTSGVNWKESLTLSEMLYSSMDKTDKSTDSPKECLVSFAKRERESQLSWINEEIEHLAKLKSLLEANKKRPGRSTVSTSVPNMAVSKMADYKKSTAVYMITTEKHDGEGCAKNCGSKTVQSASGEIDFHVHNNLGVRDYKFKEIITKITPRDREDSAIVITAPSVASAESKTVCDRVAPSVRSLSGRRVGCADVDDSFSERRPGTPCRHPSGSCGGDKACPSGATVGGGRRARDKLATLPTLHAHATARAASRSRSRTPSSKSSSITDDTSGYPTRRRRHRTAAHSKRAGGKHRKADDADKKQPQPPPPPPPFIYQPSPAAATDDSETDSSHYESLAKYQNHSLTTDRPNQRAKEAPPPPSGAPPAAKYYNRHEEAPEFGQLPLPMHAGGGAPKKDSYKQYRAAKQKEFQESAARRSKDAVDKLGKKQTASLPPPSTKESHERRRHGEKHHHKASVDPKTTWTSDAEPHSISEDDEIKQYRQSAARRRSHEKRRSVETPLRPETLKKGAKKKASGAHQPLIAAPAVGDAQEAMRVPRLAAKSDSDEAGKAGTAAVNIFSKTDTERQHSFERCTNTEGPWNEEEEDDDDYYEQEDDVFYRYKTPQRDQGVIHECDVVVKPSKTGTVSLQTIHAPKYCERGVMKPDEKKPTVAKDIQVGVERPLMKQMCVGDDVKHTAKETASQIPAKMSAAAGHPKSGLRLTPAAVVTYMPTGGDGITGPDVRPFKMVKDMSKINLNSAVIISSVVTSSVSNPDDNIRRLVLEMPLNAHKESKDGKVCRMLKRSDKKKEPAAKDSACSLLSCSCCLHSSSSRITATSGSTTDLMCSCCGKCVISSESSFTMGENNMAPPGSGPFCWPCYCNSANRGEWPAVVNGGAPPLPDANFYPQPPQQAMYPPPPSAGVEDSALEKIRDTLRQLAEIDNQEEEEGGGGVGVGGGGCGGGGGNSKKGERLVCNACNKKIKHGPQKKPVAYVLKFEPGETADDGDKSSQQSLQEIRVKLPVGKAAKLAAGGSSGGGSSRNKAKRSNKSEKDDAAGARNLQDYLSLNRPDFMVSAENRRRFLIEMAYMREQRCRRYKDLLHLPSGDQGCGLDPNLLQKPRLFTTKEMKRMTAKNYKKLPEVQEKLINTKRERMKETNKFLVNIFNKKLRETVLRGQASLSTSISVINM